MSTFGVGDIYFSKITENLDLSADLEAREMLSFKVVDNGQGKN